MWEAIKYNKTILFIFLLAVKNTFPDINSLLAIS